MGFLGLTEKTVCHNCLQNAGLSHCAACNETVPSADLIVTRRDTVCVHCAEDAGYFQCNGCEDWTHGYDGREGADGDCYCESCYSTRFVGCEECGYTLYRGDSTYHAGCYYCHSCAPQAENFSPSGFNSRGCTSRIGSERCYGIELETNDCDDYHELVDSGAWGAKDDCSVNGKEFYSAILSGDDGLDAVATIAACASRNDWKAGNGCGYHLHLDMRGENDDSRYAAAYAYCATASIWHDFVAEARRGDIYCSRIRWDCADLTAYAGRGNSFYSFVGNLAGGRRWINLDAINTHTTFEVRLHQGSIDGIEVCNWVKAHTRFVDWACTIGLAGIVEKLDGKTHAEKFEIIASEAWRDDDLRAYYADKAGYSACAA
jgi:hypothetical protein